MLLIFFEFLSTEFATCLKPPSRDNHRKASFQGRKNVTKVRLNPHHVISVVVKTTPGIS